MAHLQVALLTRALLTRARTGSASTNHRTLSAVYSSHSGGKLETWKIVATGYSGSQAPHASGLM
jgi:hypothetical protein